MRASFAFAKFRFSDKVELTDVNNAWELYSKSLESFGMETQGELKDSVLPGNDKQRQGWIEQALYQVANAHKKLQHSELLVALQNNKDLCRNLDQAKAIVQELVNGGTLLNTGESGEYKWAS